MSRLIRPPSDIRLGGVLKAWRNANCFDQRSAAEMIGIPYSTFARLERGFDPDARTLAKILRWLLGE